ncbi:MAG: hypothetical protein ABSG59_18440 [Verrucomicrobiota bacterium]|jgi:hypothetical protein
MPRIFDNIETELLPAIEQTLLVSARADFIINYDIKYRLGRDREEEEE